MIFSIHRSSRVSFAPGVWSFKVEGSDFEALRSAVQGLDCNGKDNGKYYSLFGFRA